MLKNNSKPRKRSCDFTFLFTLDRLNELDLKFMQSEEFADLFRQRDALYAQIIDGLSEGKKAALIGYSDINSEISEQKQKFFYRHAFRDCSTMARLARGRNRIKLIIRIVD